MIRLFFIFTFISFFSFSQNFTHSGYVYNANEVGIAGIPIKVYKRITPNLQGFTQQTNYNGHSYYRSTTTDSWLGAKAACESMNGHLVTMSNQLENNFVFNTWPSGWIGYYQDKTGDFYSEPYNGWRWTDNFIIAGQQNDWDVKNSNYSSGTQLNDIKSAKTMSLFNSPVFTNSGGRYLTFNGSNTYAFTPNLQSQFGNSKIITIMMWVYPVGNGVILSELGVPSTTSSWHESVLEITGNNMLNIGLWNGVGITKVTTSIALNTWNLIGLTYDGSTLTGYKNGVNIGTVTFNRIAAHTDGGGGEVFAVGLSDITNMGSGAYGSFRFGDFKIYNTSLTSDEMNRCYMSSAFRFGIYPYSYWNGGEPNDAGGEDYAQFVGGGLWNDLPNNVWLNYVLEFDYIVTTTPWVLETVITTNASGQYSISLPTNPSIEWYIEIGNLIIPNPTSSDAQSIVSTVLNNSFNSKKYYLYDVNNDNKFTISDVYYTRGMSSGRFNSWLNPIPSYRIFNQTDWNIIKNSLSNLKTSYPGVQTMTINSPINGGVTNFYLLRTGFTN